MKYSCHISDVPCRAIVRRPPEDTSPLCELAAVSLILPAPHVQVIKALGQYSVNTVQCIVCSVQCKV